MLYYKRLNWQRYRKEEEYRVMDQKIIPFAVIFDMDGTLLKTEEVAVPAFKGTFEQLKKDGDFSGNIPTDEELMGVFGLTLEDIWNKLLPGQSDQVKKKADKLMLQKELDILKEGNTHLYPHVKEVLSKIKSKGISLFIASNGLEEYIKGVCDYFEITDWFVDLYSAGRFQIDSKDDLVAKLLQDYAVEKAIMVGDRKSDIQAGKENGLLTIGCTYGFAAEGELSGADYHVDYFQDVFPIIEKQFSK